MSVPERHAGAGEPSKQQPPAMKKAVEKTRAVPAWKTLRVSHFSKPLLLVLIRHSCLFYSPLGDVRKLDGRDPRRRAAHHAASSSALRRFTQQGLAQRKNLPRRAWKRAPANATSGGRWGRGGYALIAITSRYSAGTMVSRPPARLCDDQSAYSSMRSASRSCSPSVEKARCVGP